MEQKRFFNDDDVALIKQISDEMDANPEKYRGQGVVSGVQDEMFKEMYEHRGAMMHMTPSTYKAYMEYVAKRRKEEMEAEHEAHVKGWTDSLWKKS